jgi:hypothetical protein
MLEMSEVTDILWKGGWFSDPKVIDANPEKIQGKARRLRF